VVPVPKGGRTWSKISLNLQVVSGRFANIRARGEIKMKRVLFPISEAARLLGVHPNTIRLWELQHRIKCIRTPGGHRRIHLSEIERIVGMDGECSGEEV
jgi:excisionase family DNA binding protein